MMPWLTKITVTTPACVTKEFNLKSDGTLDKKTSASVYEGFMRRVQVKGAVGFVEVLKDLSTDQCLMYGLPPRDARMITKKAWIKAGRPDDALPRSKDTTHWPEGGGILMLDYDAPKD